MSNLITKTVGFGCSYTVGRTRKMFSILRSLSLTCLCSTVLIINSSTLITLSSVRNKKETSGTGENIIGQKDDRQEQKREQEKEHG